MFFDGIARQFTRLTGSGGEVWQRRVYAAVVALLLDAWLGDPPSRFHPVAWMGRWVAVIRQRAPQGSAAASLVYGAVTTGASAGLLGTGRVLVGPPSCGSGGTAGWLRRRSCRCFLPGED